MKMFQKFFIGNLRFWKITLFAVFVTLAWIFFWYSPWQTMLRDAVWLRMGIGLIIFIIPGFCVVGLLGIRSPGWLNHLTFGFVISHLFIAVLGLLGRLFHTSFEIIKLSMMILGLISLLTYMLSRAVSENQKRVPPHRFADMLPVLALLFFFLAVSFIVIKRDISDDDLLYLAYLTNWENAFRLDFNDLIFMGNHLLHPRFWLMSTPFAQALLSNLSGLPGILILGGYYEPFLVAIAMLSWYNLARTLYFSHRSASVSVLLQIVFLLLLSEYLHPGAPFFTQLSADKATATYILATVFIQSEIILFREMTSKNIIVCLITGLSLTLMHPITLAYLVFIGSLIAILKINKNNYKKMFAPFAILLIMLMPQIVFRFIGTQVDGGIPYDPAVIANIDGVENMIFRLGNTIFYGFNSDILKMKVPYMSRIPFPSSVLEWGWLVIPVFSMIFAVRRLRKNDTAQYIFSSFLLCAIAGIPFTGWVLGYFLSAWMLERAVWLFPFGISAVFLFLSIRDVATSGKFPIVWMRKLRIKHNVSNIFLVVVTFFCSTVMILFLREQHLPDFAQFETKSRRYEDIASVGQYLDRQIPVQAIAMGSDALNDLIPGISWKVKLVTFRISDPSNMLYYTPEEIHERISDRQTIFSEITSPDVKLELLRKYDVRFVVLTRADRDLFADLVTAYPSLVQMEKVNRFFVLEIKEE